MREGRARGYIAEQEDRRAELADALDQTKKATDRAARDYVVEQLERAEENAAADAEKARWQFIADHAWLNALDHDPVNSPSHYKMVPGIEAIQVTEHFNFNLGNAIKYIWRSEFKGKQVEDLRKARQSIDLELARLEREANPLLPVAGRGHGDHFGYEETS